MSHDDPGFNPYQAPALSNHAGFPWRVIPATLMILLGGAFVLTAEAVLFIGLLLTPEPAAYFRSRAALWIPFLNIVGGFWITGGVYFWRRLWWKAALCLVVAYASGVAGAYLIGRP